MASLMTQRPFCLRQRSQPRQGEMSRPARNTVSTLAPAALAPLVDLDAIRDNTKARLTWAFGMRDTAPGVEPLRWLQQGLQRAGEVAIEDTIDLGWVQTQLRDAVSAATERRPAYLLAAVDFAMFESWNRFIVRLGRLCYGESHLRLHLEGLTWKVTDIVR